MSDRYDLNALAAMCEEDPAPDAETWTWRSLNEERRANDRERLRLEGLAEEHCAHVLEVARFEKHAHDLACVGLVVLLTGLALWAAVLWVVLR